MFSSSNGGAQDRALELGGIERAQVLPRVVRCEQDARRLHYEREAKNALARAVFFNRLGELRDRSFENQR